jgi:hypothetical protein
MVDNGVEIYSYQKGDGMLIPALGSGKSLREAAKKAGMGERTASRRLSDPAFCAELRRVQFQMVSQAALRLGEAATEAVMTLKKLLKSKSETVRLSAARTILSLQLRATDTLTGGQLSEEEQSQIRERRRQVRFLAHAVKKSYEELGGKATIEDVWQVTEAREKELFGEDVQPLREAVLAEVMGQKQLGE